MFKFPRDAETADELHAVRALGVVYVQGYYLRRPVPLAYLDFERCRPAELAPVR
jgi:EAL domain-containing protein (putative c-di-GMP-specific phosphodiesterase class I)